MGQQFAEHNAPIQAAALKVYLTPHIVGTMGCECQRIDHLMVDKFNRYIKGESLDWVISREKAVVMA